VSSLSISIVTYFSDEKWFKATCASLFAAIAHARAHAGITRATVYLIDNTEDGSDTRTLFEGVTCAVADLKTLNGHGNIGYGAGHNLALLKTDAENHLVLNPDITMKRDALTQALALMITRRDAVCLSPRAVTPEGGFASLCKRRVSWRILALRAFGTPAMKARWQHKLDAYEYKNELTDTPREVNTASGAFMFLRTSAAKAVGGFDERFFLHFEDVDFSLRLHAQGKVLYAPQVSVVHAGGGAAGKHFSHMLKNGFRYFRKWGLGDPLKRLR
jgi:GT2 family glycosyltransferase